MTRGFYYIHFGIIMAMFQTTFLQFSLSKTVCLVQSNLHCVSKKTSLTFLTVT